jgi:hypothetical protein
MEVIGGSHLHVQSGRWISYFAPMGLLKDDRVLYVAVLSDNVGHVGVFEGVIRFDPSRADGDEAVRATIGRLIDAADLPPGTPPSYVALAKLGRIRLW